MFYKPLLGAILTGQSINFYTLLCDGEWWVCDKDGRDLIFDGKPYRKICDIDYIGYDGTRTMGIFKINKTRNLAPYNYEFIFVSDDMMPGYALMNTKCFNKYF